MDVVTRSTIEQKARVYCDMVNNDFMNAQEWSIAINDAVRRYYNLMEQLTQDYYLVQSYFTTLSNVLAYPLPDDFYHIRGVDVAYTIVNRDNLNDSRNLWVALQPYMFAERNQRAFLYYQAVTPPYFSRYRIQGNEIVFEPLTAVQGSVVRLSYTTKPPVLELPDDTIDVVAGFDDYIAKAAAMTAAARQESDVQVAFLAGELARFESEIKQLANDRNRDQATRVQDIYAKNAAVWGMW